MRTGGRIVRHRLLTHDTWELVVARDDGSPVIMAAAGQFAIIKVEGVAQPRAFSFAHDPLTEADREHTFYIRFVPGGEISAWLTTDRVGEAVELAGPLLLIDDWGLTVVNTDQQRDLLEVLEDRYHTRSTLVTSQLPVEKWHGCIADPTFANAILDRLVHNAYKLNLKGESMRKTQARNTQVDHHTA